MNSLNMKIEPYANLQGANLQGADLREANLQGANLRGANLQGAYLKGVDFQVAYLQGAYLQGAKLQGAYLQRAYLKGADLREANFQGANLQWAVLKEADLQGANLQGAYLQGAKLQGAKLQGAYLPHFQIVPSEGSFIGWKKTTKGVIRVFIPPDAERTSSLVSRKCRASRVVPLDEGGESPTYKGKLSYKKGVAVYADKFDPDIRLDCTHGIHFFMTKQEAEEWMI
jgi:hypothetical protein